MAFSSSVPNSYNLDHHPHHPLSNWHQVQQQSNHQQLGQNSQLPPPPPPPINSNGSGGEGSIRPGSMVDRARLAKLPLPEAGLNCPRCDSTNTKFCYFNNYSLTQPRHFCKTCRRYWTRGGALRSVPVGGGCRRNKRTKNRTSKSPITGDRAATNPNNTNSINEQSPSSCSSEMTNHFSAQQVPLMTALQNLGHYAAGNYGGFQAHMVGAGAGNSGQPDMGFQLGNESSGGGGEQGWRLPILAGFEQPGSNLFAYQGGEGIEQPSGQVKIEENPAELNGLSRQLFSGGSENNGATNQYWSGNNSWTTDFSSAQINVSSTNHFL